jgi:ferredoxin-like protein FixX
VDASYIARDLYRTRNMRLAFHDGFYLGGFKAGLMTLTGGRFPGGKIATHADAEAERRPGGDDALTPDGKLTISKVDAVFKSGNATRDTIPTHLIVGKDISADVAAFYAHMCPAGVYELVAPDVGAQHAAPLHDANAPLLRVNAPNCVDCKATDVLGPRWTPREGGSGPKYKRM